MVFPRLARHAVASVTAEYARGGISRGIRQVAQVSHPFTANVAVADSDFLLRMGNCGHESNDLSKESIALTKVKLL
jgi:hypothetical protein